MKDSNLSFKNIFKRETKLATYIIAVSTILVLGLSYALFFQVHSNSQNQVVQSGDLAFTYSKDGTVVPDGNINLQITDPTCFSPMTEADADSLINTCSYQFSIQNTGTLKASYQMFLKATESNTANPEHLKVILRESDGTTFNKMTGYPKTVKSINDNEGILLSGDLDKNSNILVYNIQVYLDESLTSDADYSSKVISYKLEGKSVVHEDQPISSYPTAAEEIIGLVPEADSTATDEIDNGMDASGCTNTLAYDHYGNLRYTGTDPCNYVAFNEEVPFVWDESMVYEDEYGEKHSDYSPNSNNFAGGWRIIGVFDGYVKLIRNEPIGLYSWDSSANGVNVGFGVNQWGDSGTYRGADIMNLLNPGYENNFLEFDTGSISSIAYGNNSLYWNRATANCYIGASNRAGECIFNNIGLISASQNLIDYHTWSLGSPGDIDFTSYEMGTARAFYQYERGSINGKACTSSDWCNDTVNRTTTWQGYVGLMTPSDYGYAIGGTGREFCLEYLNVSDYNSTDCSSDDWLISNSQEPQWTMTSKTSSTSASEVFIIDSSNALSYVRAYINNSVRPVVYLKSSVRIVSGNGTIESPYVFALQ